MNSIHKGDCLELMQHVPSKSVDMILCDLPYGTTACKWDVIIPFEPLWKQYERIIKDNGAIVLFGKQPFITELVYSNKALYRYELIWDKKRCPNGTKAKQMPMQAHESIILFYKKQPVYNPQMTAWTEAEVKRMRKNAKSHTPVSSLSFRTSTSPGRDEKVKRGKYPSSVIRIPAIGSNAAERIHPTQKPVALFEYLIKTYTNEGETVLDNCSGSGTTGLACINTNRNYILMEKEEKYYNIILERIQKHTPQLKLIA